MENIIFAIFMIVFLFTVYLWFQWSKKINNEQTKYKEEDLYENEPINKNKFIKTKKEPKVKIKKEKKSLLNFGKKNKKEDMFEDEIEEQDDWNKNELRDRSKNKSYNDFDDFEDFEEKSTTKKTSTYDDFDNDDDDFDFDFEEKNEIKETKKQNKSTDLFGDMDLTELETMFGNDKEPSKNKKNEFDGLDDMIVKNKEEKPKTNDLDFDFNFDLDDDTEKTEIKKDNDNLKFLEQFDFESEERNLIQDDYFEKKNVPEKLPAKKISFEDDLELDLGLFSDLDQDVDGAKKEFDIGNMFANKETKTEVKKKSESEFDLDLDLGLDDDDDILKKIDKLYDSTK